MNYGIVVGGEWREDEVWNCTMYSSRGRGKGERRKYGIVVGGEGQERGGSMELS